MTNIVFEKFQQNPLLAKRLLETGDCMLQEGNYWKDLFWGVDLKTGEGENHLGKILMELREIYKREGLPGDYKKILINVYESKEGIKVVDEDITQLEVECIVNPADKTLLCGNGVNGTIHREAGPELLEECRLLSGCEISQAKITKGYLLKAEYVIHTVCPVYGKDKEELLEICYRNCLDLAVKHEIHSIAFPALSTGKFCFPKEKAMKIAVETVKKWLKEHEGVELKIIFSCIDHKVFDYACKYMDC